MRWRMTSPLLRMRCHRNLYEGSRSPMPGKAWDWQCQPLRNAALRRGAFCARWCYAKVWLSDKEHARRDGGLSAATVRWNHGTACSRWWGWVRCQPSHRDSHHVGRIESCVACSPLSVVISVLIIRVRRHRLPGFRGYVSTRLGATRSLSSYSRHLRQNTGHGKGSQSCWLNGLQRIYRP